MATRTIAPEMVLKIPPAKTAWSERIAFAYAAREKLRLDHNAHGKDFRDGKITPDEWAAYLAEDFQPRQNAINETIHALRGAPTAADLAEVSLTDSFEEKARV